MPRIRASFCIFDVPLCLLDHAFCAICDRSLLHDGSVQKSPQNRGQKIVILQWRFFAQGKQLGRPRIDPATEKRIQAQLRGGKGMRKIAREIGVGTGTVQRVRQEMEGPFVGAAA